MITTKKQSHNKQSKRVVEKSVEQKKNLEHQATTVQDSRPEASARNNLQQMINKSPFIAAQRLQRDSLTNSAEQSVSVLQKKPGGKKKGAGKQKGTGKETGLDYNTMRNFVWLRQLFVFLQSLQTNYPDKDPEPASEDVAYKDTIARGPVKGAVGSGHHTSTAGSGAKRRKVNSDQLIADVEALIEKVLSYLDLENIPEACKGKSDFKKWFDDNDPSGAGGGGLGQYVC